MNLDESFDNFQVPLHIRGALERYVNNRIAPGGFLTALLANDLMESMGRADHINKRYIFEICNWVYNCAPRNCHGSYEAIDNWISSKNE